MKLSAISLVNVLVVLTQQVSAGTVPQLTPDNYDSLTEGKTVFIKFFAPWCGHCKKMAPDWEKLSDEYESNETGLVAEVDCTSAGGKKLCDQEGVQGFPTLKYGDPSDLQDYKGGRSYQDMSTFAAQHLLPICSLAHLDLCDSEKRAELQALQSKSVEELEAAIQAEEAKLQKADDEFKTEVQKLQDLYQELVQKKDDAIAAVKDAGLGLMKSVLKAKKAEAMNKDEL